MRTPLLRRAALAFALMATSVVVDAADHPNILWITSEDNGPQLGAYGDDFADTPHLDALAAEGMAYVRCWSNAPVCAPARTTIISGLYPTSTGAQHMRSMTRLPEGMEMFPVYLREAGYYCTNRSKEDYNLEKTGEVWDESSRKAHWKNRAEGQPFFAVFNFTTTHESQIRKRPHRAVHDPAKVRVPAYHPDAPEVRQDWAQYYDKMTEMDRQVGGLLAELEEAGLDDETIVFYYGDHGPGMPRGKRWPYDSGLRVPLIVRVPEKLRSLAPDDWKVGGMSRHLVGFIDLAPTVLSLAGIRPPDHMQGHAFLGEHRGDSPDHLFGFRGRMDERYDLVRTVTDGRWVYIRNYMPHEPYGQFVSYMFQTPTTRVWKAMFDAGRLDEAQSTFWRTKAPEELYDLESDPDEVHNLAGSREHRAVRRRLGKALTDHMLRIRDLGFLPEGEIHSRSAGSTPYEMGHDPKRYPLVPILHTADVASSLDMDAIDSLLEALEHGDSAVRYWGTLGLLMRAEPAVRRTQDELVDALQDPSWHVRCVAAEALARYADEDDREAAIELLVEAADMVEHGPFVAMLALNALDILDESKVLPHLDTIRELPRKGPAPPRTGGYCGRLLSKIIDDLEAASAGPPEAAKEGSTR